MCLIIVKPAESIITRRTLKTGFNNNSDGAGFMFAHDSKLEIIKGFFHFRKFYKTFRIYERAYPESNFVIHFRIATSGLIDTDNCHPYSVNPNLGFAHNGIFTGLGTRHISDTQVFNLQVLRKLPTNFLGNTLILNALERYNKVAFCKLAFLDGANNYTIINSQAGDWDNGIWYSNTSYKDYSFGFSNQSYQPYDDWTSYSSKVYRKCACCDGTYNLSMLSWDKASAGWKCDDCIRIENKYQVNLVPSYRHGCSICSFAEAPYTFRHTYYCERCWHDLIEFYSIICPYCNMNTTVDTSYRCMCCGTSIGEEDFMELLDAVCPEEYYNV